MTKIIKKGLKSDCGYYFPLFNNVGLMSAITPRLSGDIKINYHHYITEPITEKDLNSSVFTRNVIFYVDQVPYSLNGLSYHQQSDKMDLEVGLLYQKVTRYNKKNVIEVTSFNPNDTWMELHQVTYKNITGKDQSVRILTATPIYGRSADNLRDHRHVTSLLNRTFVKNKMILLKPTLSFDERGHKETAMNYAFMSDSSDLTVKAYYPILDTFVGTGTMLYPKPSKAYKELDSEDGYETIGAIEYDTVTVKKDETLTFYFALAASDDLKKIESYQSYLNPKDFNRLLEESIRYWEKEVGKLSFEIDSPETSNLLKFVALQPILRRFFGNSYMPHHDYGRGGKGWRDLWQDLLSLIMYQDDTVKETLLNNFEGIRIDGSNATIIGEKPGEFKADRNNIVRVWSDHAAWPLLTTLLYINETGDINFLLEKKPYFDDQFTHYTKKTKRHIGQNNRLYNQSTVYEGSVLEHLLLENVVGALNTGAKGFVRLEDADWNDGLDMAHDLGETLAFTHFYASNLKRLHDLLALIDANDIILFESLGRLILSMNQKDVSLRQYFDEVAVFDQVQLPFDKKAIMSALNKKHQSMVKHLRQYGKHHSGALQSYIDNDGAFLDNDSLSLTGQAMALLSQTVSMSEAKKIARVTKSYLFDKKIGGYKLNSDYKTIKLNMGRAYGFAYGHKENGAVFSHMAIMHGYGLYQYDLINYGRETLFSIINQALNEKSHVLAGIPEYFTPNGIGKYAYLTGSASWLLKTLRQQVFGITMNIGVLTLNPKLAKQDFISGKASIKTYLFGHQRQITYYNPKGLNYGDYCIREIKVNGVSQPNNFDHLDGDIEVYLDELL